MLSVESLILTAFFKTHTPPWAVRCNLAIKGQVACCSLPTYVCIFRACVKCENLLIARETSTKVHSIIRPKALFLTVLISLVSWFLYESTISFLPICSGVPFDFP